MVSLLLFLFLLASPVFPSDTTFVFSGKLSCMATGPFHVRMTALEWDALTANDVLKTVELSGEFAIMYNFTTSEDDDGWFLDKTFELQLEFIHNCNPWEFFRPPLSFTIDVAEIPIDGVVHYINVPDINLTNRGTKWSSAYLK